MINKEIIIIISWALHINSNLTKDKTREKNSKIQCVRENIGSGKDPVG